MKRMLSLLFLLIFKVPATYSFSPQILFKVVSQISELIPLALDIKNIVDEATNTEGDERKQTLALLENLQKVQNQMVNMLSDLKDAVDLNAYMTSILTARSAITVVKESCMEFLKALDENERNRKSTDCKNKYENNNIDTVLQTLVDLAKGIPLPPIDSMPHLILRRLNCNMTAIRLFEKSYSSWIIDLIVLQGIYIDMTGGNAVSKESKWKNDINSSLSGMLEMEKICNATYSEYAIKDLKEIDSASTLHKTVQEKYLLEAFIAFYSPVSGYRYHSVYANYTRTKNVFLQMTDSKNKVMAFCEKKDTDSAYQETRVKILQKIDTYKSARTDDRDTETTIHIQGSILDTTGSIGIYPYAIVIFADHPNFPLKENVEGYCANEVYFMIKYDSVYEHSDIVWKRVTYRDVTYHIHIFLPSPVIDQPTIGSTHTYRTEANASFKANISTSLFIISILLAVIFS